jgi:hypothetical protein
VAYIHIQRDELVVLMVIDNYCCKMLLELLQLNLPKFTFCYIPQTQTQQTLFTNEYVRKFMITHGCFLCGEELRKYRREKEIKDFIRRFFFFF